MARTQFFLRRSRSVGLTLALMLLTATVAHGAEPATPRDPIAILSDGIFSKSEVRRLLRDQTEVVRMKEVSPRELAMVLACLTSEAPPAALARFRTNRPLSAGPDAELTFSVAPVDAKVELRDFTLGKNARAEATRYVEVEAGYELNLDESEIERFRALRDAPEVGRLETVDEMLRLTLADRLAGFARAGLDGTPPYARGGGEVSRPAWELEQSYAAFRAEPPLFPRLYRAWTAYPRKFPEGAHDEFFVSRAEIDGRPAAILTHRMVDVFDDRGVLAERDFYVSHFFDSALNVVAVLPAVETEGNLFLFVHRVWVDRWGAMVRMKRALGHKAIAERLRKSVAAREICGR